MYTADHRQYKPMGYQAIVPTTSTALTVPTGAKYALITTEVQAVRFTDDGTTPTTDIGLVIKVTDPPLWYAGRLEALLFFDETAGSLVKILYYS